MRHSNNDVLFSFFLALLLLDCFPGFTLLTPFFWLELSSGGIFVHLHSQKVKYPKKYLESYDGTTLGATLFRV